MRGALAGTDRYGKGALRHHLVLRDGALVRMLPWVRGRD
ncbi:hypothetical protein ACVWZA_003818 [Sphingomonas sp. UYAg733]